MAPFPSLHSTYWERRECLFSWMPRFCNYAALRSGVSAAVGISS